MIPEADPHQEGYYLNETALQLLVADAESWEATANAWMDAYYEIIKRHEEYVSNSKEILLDLQEKIDLERNQWKKAVLAERHKLRGGFFLGSGYSKDGFEVVVGFGLLIPIF